MGSFHACRKTDVAEGLTLEATVVAECVQIRPCQIGQRRCTARRDRQHPGAAVGGLRARARRAALGRRFQDHVSVRAAETEGIHAGPRRLPVGFRPRLQLLRNAQLQVVESDLRVRTFKVQVGGNPAVSQTQRCLDQSRDACGRFQVTHIALDRADHAMVTRLASLPIDRPDRGGLDRIAHRSSSPVCLHILHGFRRNISQPQGIGDI